MKRSGVPFDAILVEIALRDFLRGPRAQLSTHADMFRIGDPRYFGRLLSAIAKEIRARSKGAVVSALPARARSSPRGRLDVAANDLAKLGVAFRVHGKPEPSDHHWLAISALIVALDAVLPPYERPPRRRTAPRITPRVRSVLH
jgi:hypothetical protein